MNKIHPDLIVIQQLIYQPRNMHFSQVEPELESQDYGACTFELEGMHVKFRVAKITPKKVGQFVTFWKREDGGPIKPFDVEDDFQFLVVSARFQDRFGQFSFPKNILLQNGILARSGKGGKRALRVYPPWDQATNRQARKTQEWQLAYFQEIHEMEQSTKMMNIQPTLRGDLLELRPLQDEDYSSLFEAASDPLIWEMHPQPDRYKPDVFESFFSEAMASKGALVIIDLKNLKIVGTSRYYDYDPRNSSVVIGYTFLTREYWGGKYNRAEVTQRCKALLDSPVGTCSSPK